MNHFLGSPAGTALLAALLAGVSVAGCKGDDGGNDLAPDAGNPDTDLGDTDPDSTPCPAGTEDCPCDSGMRCDEELTCNDSNVCVEPRTQTGSVSDPAARSCEVLLVEGDARVLGATFGDGVRGAVERRSPHVAVAFFRTADEPFATGTLSLQLEGTAGGFSVRSVDCFDRLGQPLAGADISFGD